MNLTEESIQKRLLTEQMFFEIGVLKNFAIFRRRKTSVESVFSKVASLQLSCEYCEIFKSSFFHKTHPVAASEKFINFPGKHEWRRRNMSRGGVIDLSS